MFFKCSTFLQSLQVLHARAVNLYLHEGGAPFPRSNRWSLCRYPRIYGEGPVAELAAVTLERYWPMPLLTPLCQTVASCERKGQTADVPVRLLYRRSTKATQ